MRIPGLASVKFHLTRSLGLRPRYDFGIISTRPLILFTHYDDNLWSLLHKLRRHRLHCLITCYWSLTVPDQQQIARRLSQWMRDHPHHHVEHLAPSATELAVLCALEVPGFLCHQNCLVDERIFQIFPDEPKLFRAIYDARLTPFKRHPLAAEVANLALITYDIPLNRDERYNSETRACLRDAVWLNGPYSDHPDTLPAHQVARHLNQARVGLILSALEGANYASIQYLLCGLPVVTTHNKGGRDEFFDPDYVIWADATPQSVSAAVNELIARNLAPEEIRERTLQRMRQHRAVLEDWITRAVAPAPAPVWETYFCNKLLHRHSDLDLRRLKLRISLGLSGP